MIQLRRLVMLAAVAALRAPSALAAQDAQLAAGIAATDAHDFPAARRYFDAVLQVDSTSYEGNWRMALMLTDIAKQTPDTIRSPTRDSLYRQAEKYARRAVAAREDDAQGHFALANAIGRGALSMGARARVRRALEVRREALRAIDLDPRHDGAWHILGRWNAEVRRLSGLQRFMARTFLGAEAFGLASWDEAERDLGRAVDLAPWRIVHRFDLAAVLLSRQKWAAALEQLDALVALPASDVLDPGYQREARMLALQVARRLRQ